jgi:hypothetical protein
MNCQATIVEEYQNDLKAFVSNARGSLDGRKQTLLERRARRNESILLFEQESALKLPASQRSNNQTISDGIAQDLAGLFASSASIGSPMAHTSNASSGTRVSPVAHIRNNAVSNGTYVSSFAKTSTKVLALSLLDGQGCNKVCPNDMVFRRKLSLIKDGKQGSMLAKVGSLVVAGHGATQKYLAEN